MNLQQVNDQRMIAAAHRKEIQKKKDLARLRTQVKEWRKTGWKGDPVKPKQRVQILTAISGLLHRKRQTGIVKYRNGSYVYVEPHWIKGKKWLVECYDCELVVY